MKAGKAPQSSLPQNLLSDEAVVYAVLVVWRYCFNSLRDLPVGHFNSDRSWHSRNFDFQLFDGPLLAGWIVTPRPVYRTRGWVNWPLDCGFRQLFIRAAAITPQVPMHATIMVSFIVRVQKWPTCAKVSDSS